MKIINKPDVSNWDYKHKCKNCESELLVEASDINCKYYAGDYRDPSSESFSAVCIVCNDSFVIPNNSIPKLIQINAKKK